MIQFMKDVLVRIWDAVLDFFRNLETVAILTLASLGASSLLAGIPFVAYIPPAIEAWLVIPMVIPVLSVLVVGALVGLIEWRSQ